jgi:hypothetical protein
MSSKETRYRGPVLASGVRVLREDDPGTTELVGDTTFEWGIDSDASGQLAFALLKDTFGEESAEALRTDFKFDVVIELDGDWVLTASRWVDRHGHSRGQVALRSLD